METTCKLPGVNIYALKEKKHAAQSDPGHGIDEIVCAAMSVADTQLLKQRTRKREICNARQVCMWWRSIYTKENYSTIGSRYGSGGINYDHATVTHAKKTVNDLIETDASFRAMTRHVLQEAEIKVLRSTPEGSAQKAINAVLMQMSNILSIAWNIQDKKLAKSIQDRVSNAIIILRGDTNE